MQKKTDQPNFRAFPVTVITLLSAALCLARDITPDPEVDKGLAKLAALLVAADTPAADKLAREVAKQHGLAEAMASAKGSAIDEKLALPREVVEQNAAVYKDRGYQIAAFAAILAEYPVPDLTWKRQVSAKTQPEDLANWKAWVKQLREGGVKFAAAADKKDVAGLKAAAVAVTAACTNCHASFRPLAVKILTKTIGDSPMPRTMSQAKFRALLVASVTLLAGTVCLARPTRPDPEVEKAIGKLAALLAAGDTEPPTSSLARSPSSWLWGDNAYHSGVAACLVRSAKGSAREKCSRVQGCGLSDGRLRDHPRDVPAPCQNLDWEKSRAELLEKWKGSIKDLREGGLKFAAAADKKDVAGMKAAATSYGAACEKCHDTFRGPPPP